MFMVNCVYIYLFQRQSTSHRENSSAEIPNINRERANWSVNAELSMAGTNAISVAHFAEHFRLAWSGVRGIAPYGLQSVVGDVVQLPRRIGKLQDSISTHSKYINWKTSWLTITFRSRCQWWCGFHGSCVLVPAAGTNAHRWTHFRYCLSGWPSRSTWERRWSKNREYMVVKYGYVSHDLEFWLWNEKHSSHGCKQLHANTMQVLRPRFWN